jgi:hypothetical protein
MPIDSSNKFQIVRDSPQNPCLTIRVAVPPVLPIADALNLAAWLVAVSGATNAAFMTYLERVQNS